MTDPTAEPTYSDYFGLDGQPVRPSVQLDADDLALYRQYYADEATTTTTTEETR